MIPVKFGTLGLPDFTPILLVNLPELYIPVVSPPTPHPPGPQRLCSVASDTCVVSTTDMVESFLFNSICT